MQNKNAKRLISILICLAMVLAALPMAVLAADTTIYVQPNDNWLKDGARFAAYFFGNGETWVDCVEAGDGLYSVEVPAGYSNVIFCRMNPNSSSNDWNNKWNQTSDLDVPSDNKVVYVVDGWDNGAGQWIEKGGEVVEIEKVYYIRGTMNGWGLDNPMTKNDDGTYTATINLAVGTYTYKAADQGWGDNWGEGGVGGGDITLNVTTAGDYIFILDTVVGTVTAALVETEQPGGDDEPANETVLEEGTLNYSSSSWLGHIVKYTPAENCTVTVEVSACDPGCNINLLDVTAAELLEDYKSSEPMTKTFDLVAGHEYEIGLNIYEVWSETLYDRSAGTLTYKITVPAGGESGDDNNEPTVIENNAPSAVAVGSNEYTIGTNNTGVVSAIYTATEAGTLTITATAMSGFDGAEWNTMNPGMQFGMMYAMNVKGENVYAPTYTVDVAVGDTFSIGVMSFMGTATKITLDVAFEAADADEAVVLEEGTKTLLSDTIEYGGNMESYVFEYTPTEDGILSVIMGASTPGWKYQFKYADGTTTLGTKGTGSNTEEFEVKAGNTYEVEFWCYNVTGWCEANGDINYKITFTPSEISSDVTLEDYIVSDTVLVVGSNNLIMEENAANTLFDFEPTETGVYTFTAPEGVLIGNWGTSFNPVDNTAEKTNTFEWECTAVGQDILIGIVAAEGLTTVNLDVDKTEDSGPIEEIVYESYENVHAPSVDNLIDIDGEEPTNVDITKPQTVVLGEDGFFHMGSANGPVVYVSLINDAIDFVQGFFGGYGALTMRGAYTDEEGNVYYYDFLDAMRAYAAVINSSDYDNSLYPLTEDLAIFLKAFGAYQGWYTASVTPFEEIKAEHDADSAWLVACCYFGEIEDEQPGDDEQKPGDDEQKPGDDEQKPGDDEQKPGDDEQKPGDDEQKPGDDEQKPGDDEQKPGDDEQKPGDDEQKPGDDEQKPGDDESDDDKKPSDDESPKTADMSLAAVAVALMAATAGLVIVTKKKEF